MTAFRSKCDRVEIKAAMEFKFSIYTVVSFNNMAELYVGDDAYLTVKPSADLSKLPQRYRDFVYGTSQMRSSTALSRASIVAHG